MQEALVLEAPHACVLPAFLATSWWELEAKGIFSSCWKEHLQEQRFSSSLHYRSIHLGRRRLKCNSSCSLTRHCSLHYRSIRLGRRRWKCNSSCSLTKHCSLHYRSIRLGRRRWKRSSSCSLTRWNVRDWTSSCIIIRRNGGDCTSTPSIWFKIRWPRGLLLTTCTLLFLLFLLGSSRGRLEYVRRRRSMRRHTTSRYVEAFLEAIFFCDGAASKKKCSVRNYFGGVDSNISLQGTNFTLCDTLIFHITLPVTLWNI
jgi:hypothetical protein